MYLMGALCLVNNFSQRMCVGCLILISTRLYLESMYFFCVCVEMLCFVLYRSVCLSTSVQYVMHMLLTILINFYFICSCYFFYLLLVNFL